MFVVHKLEIGINTFYCIFLERIRSHRERGGERGGREREVGEGERERERWKERGREGE